MSYEITLDFYYQTFDSFKQKGALIIQNLFRDVRMADYARFHGYGLITTNGHKADKITIEDVDKFNRLKTNCLVYDLTYNKYNPGKYDKLFIYRTNTSKDNSFYGYILYNTKTDKTTNVYNIEYLDDKLYRYVYRAITHLADDKLWDFYSKKYDALKKRNGLTLADCPTVEDWHEMKKYYENFWNLPFSSEKYL